jgi:hypothetical protein
MARRAIGVNDAPADSAPIGSGPTRWAALAEVPRAHEVVGWRPGDLGWVARRDAPSPMARRAIGVNDAPADYAWIEPGLAMWGALVEVPPAHEDVGWRPPPNSGWNP